MTRKPGSGRPATKMPTFKVNALKRYMAEQVGRSQARAAAKFKVTQQYVSKVLKSKSALRYRRSETVSSATEAQKEKQKSKMQETENGCFEAKRRKYYSDG